MMHLFHKPTSIVLVIFGLYFILLIQRTKSSRRCEPWLYGANCDKLCGMCKGARCNENDGTCPIGCLDGWRGVKCLDPCKDRTYGPNCILTCSEGCKHKTCVKSNGVCSVSGCETGYKGRWCNIPG